MTETSGNPTAESGARPWWMTAFAAACLLTLAANIIRDLFFPETRNIEVWFGFEVTGNLALLSAPLHWVVFAVGVWAFWTARPWVTSWAAVYLFYVAFSHLVWSEASPNGRGWPIGLLQAVVISGIAIMLLRNAPSASRRREQ
jgi:hypothetical protein